MKKLRRIVSLAMVSATVASLLFIPPSYGKEETAKELTDLRTLSSKTYEQSDGSMSTIVHAEPIHYIAESGCMEEIDSTLKRTDYCGYSYVNKANDWHAYFSDKPGENPKVMLEKDRHVLDFSLECNGIAKVKVDGNKIVYQNVFEDVDVAYTVLGNAVKEELIIKSPSDLGEITFNMHPNNLAVNEKDGIVGFEDKSGNSIFEAGSLYMEDAKGVRSEKIRYETAVIGEGYEYKVVLDDEFLNDPDTAYPVVIDPSYTVTGSSSTYDTCVDQQYPSSNYYLSENLWTGGLLGTNAMRTYIKFDLPTSFYGNQITTAYLRIKKNAYDTPTIKAYRVTSSWTPSTVTWSNKPGHKTTGTNTITQYSGNWYQINTTTIVRSWMNGDANYGFVLKEPSESSQTHKTRYYSSDAASPNKPELVINYRNCGSRPYQTCIAGNSVNCMGYALEYTDYITFSDLGITVADFYELNGSDNAGILAFVKGQVVDWMNDNMLGLYEDDASYTDNITGNYFIAGLRVGFNDSNNDNVFNYTAVYSEYFDFHWWYRTNDGTWADKLAEMASVHRTDTNASTNPANITWQGTTLIYDSEIEYFKINDVREPNILWYRDPN